MVEVTIAVEDVNHPDAQQLIRLLSAELGSRYGDDGSGAFVAADVQGPRAAFVVARVNGSPVGCGGLRSCETECGPGVAEIKRMFVEPPMRGRGIARRILQRLEELAHEFGYHTLVMETGNKQPEAIHLYETSGYSRIPSYGRWANQPRSICLQKRLVAPAIPGKQPQ